MKLTYFGTAAAEGVPAIFCNCELCQQAKKNGGKDIRTRSQALVDERLLLDFPGDSYLHFLKYGYDLANIEQLLVTHGHADHFYPEDLMMRMQGYGANLAGVLTVYGDFRVQQFFERAQDLEGYRDDSRLKFQAVVPFETLFIADYRVTPLIADHDQKEDCLFYDIKGPEKRLLYAHDTGYFPEADWDYFERVQPHYDLVSLDCTAQGKNSSRNHMGFPNNLEVKKRMLELGVADEQTIFVCNHFSHNNSMLHEEMVAMTEPHGFVTAYDGLTIEV